MKPYTCMDLQVFILLFVIPTASATTELPELEMFESTSGFYGDTMDATCKKGEVIVIAEVHVGVDPFYFYYHWPSFNISWDLETCCVREDTLCTFRLAAYKYAIQCNGQPSCKVEIEQWLDVVPCTEPYNARDEFFQHSYYMFLTHYCIEKARLIDVCSYSTSLSTNNTSLYMWNLESINTTNMDIGSYCACSVEIDNCNSQLQINSMYNESMTHGSVRTCNNITIYDRTDKLVLNLPCQGDSRTLGMYTVNDTYIQLKISIPENNLHLKFVAAVRASKEANVMIQCPPSPQHFCTNTADETPDSIQYTADETTGSTADETPDSTQYTGDLVITAVASSTSLILTMIPFVITVLSYKRYSNRKREGHIITAVGSSTCSILIILTIMIIHFLSYGRYRKRKTGGFIITAVASSTCLILIMMTVVITVRYRKKGRDYVSSDAYRRTQSHSSAQPQFYNTRNKAKENAFPENVELIEIAPNIDCTQLELSPRSPRRNGRAGPRRKNKYDAEISRIWQEEDECAASLISSKSSHESNNAQNQDSSKHLQWEVSRHKKENQHPRSEHSGSIENRHADDVKRKQDQDCVEFEETNYQQKLDISHTSDCHKKTETNTQMETAVCKEKSSPPVIEQRIQIVKPLKTSNRKTEGCSKPAEPEKKQEEMTSYGNLDWNTIFIRLIQMLPAAKWKLFFICLYGYGDELDVFPAGMSVDGKISQIEARVDTKLDGVQTLFFELFKEWRELFGEHANPCYIENALREMGYNDILNRFKNIMRNPPQLRSSTTSLDTQLVKTRSNAIEFNLHKPVSSILSYAVLNHAQSQQATESSSKSLEVRCRQSNEFAVHMQNMAATGHSGHSYIGECSKHLTLAAYNRPCTAGQKRHFSSTDSDSDVFINHKLRKHENQHLPKRYSTHRRRLRSKNSSRQSRKLISSVELNVNSFIDLIMRYLPFEGQVLNEKEYHLFLDHHEEDT